jgi:glycosyltransferase involved in cell wall biosynthesis
MTTGNGLRIAHLIETDGPGGAERMLANLVLELQAGGSYNLVVLPADREGWLTRELAGSGVAIEYFRLDRPVSPATARWLTALLRRHRIGLAHCHEFTMAVYGAWAAWRNGIPHVSTMHGSRYYAGRLRRRVALRVAASLGGKMVAVSQALAQQLRRDLWLPRSRVTTIANGVRCVPAGRSTLREELRLEPEDRLAIAVGNLYPVKGHRYAVAALGLLRARQPRLHLAIAGRGETADLVTNEARQLGVADRLHLLGLRADIPNLLAGADLFVLPSVSEGLPLALLEAMFAGCPVVATDVGEIRNVLEDGKAGVVVPPGDAGALATGLDQLLSSPARARDLADRARRRVESEYDVATMAERYVTLYHATAS